MGLDMYLTKKVYIGAKYEHRKVTGEISLKIDGKPVNIKLNRISYINEEVGYWRKANQIHKWFVDNVQGGEDNCGDYWVSPKHLKELLELCKKVKNNPKEAPELLPTEEGFFFGGTEYGDEYMRDIDDTIDILEKVLSEEDYGNDEYSYHASW
jgi:hypothetical protein